MPRKRYRLTDRWKLLFHPCGCWKFVRSEYAEASDTVATMHGWAEAAVGACHLAWNAVGLVQWALHDAPAERHSSADDFAQVPRDDEEALRWARRFWLPRIGDNLTLVVEGTSFQLQVWRQLLSIPTGSTTTYGALAALIGQPEAARAVGTAVSANKLGWVIPCHRVTRADGATGGFAWGRERKAQLLALERAPTMLNSA